MNENDSTIKCGCGFNAVGPDQKVNKEAFELHTCFDGDFQVTSWYSGLFSLWGAVILFIATWAIVEIVKAVQ